MRKGMESDLGEQAGTASLDRFDFCFGPRQSVEALGKLITVEVFALLRLNRTKGGTGGAANGANGTRRKSRATKGTVLLSLGAVGSKGVRKNTRGRGGMSSRGVVHGS